MGGVEEAGVDEDGCLGATGLRELRIASRLIPVSRSPKRDRDLKRDKKIKGDRRITIFLDLHRGEMLVSLSLFAWTALNAPVKASHVPSGTDSIFKQVANLFGGLNIGPLYVGSCPLEACY